MTEADRQDPKAGTRPIEVEVAVLGSRMDENFRMLADQNRDLSAISTKLDSIDGKFNLQAAATARGEIAAAERLAIIETKQKQLQKEHDDFVQSHIGEGGMHDKTEKFQRWVLTILITGAVAIVAAVIGSSWWFYTVH